MMANTEKEFQKLIDDFRGAKYESEEKILRFKVEVIKAMNLQRIAEALEKKDEL